MTFGRMVQSVEFALFARICSVAAVVIGAVATVALSLGAVIMTDMRGDLKDVVNLSRRLDTRAEVTEHRLVNVERRLEKIEVVSYPWNQPPFINRGEPTSQQR